jgi:hypothetical protein
MRVGFGLACALIVVAGSAAFADNVKAQRKGRTLVVTGDAGTNQIVLSNPSVKFAESSGTTVEVRPLGDTTVNGSAQAASFDGIVSIKANLGDGDDELTCDQLSIDGSLKVNCGAGNDKVTVTSATILSDASISGSSGALTFASNSASFEHNLTVKGGSGDDALTLDSTSVDADTRIILGPGNNSFHDTSSSFSQFFSLTAGSGTDTVTLQATSIGEAAHVALGTGANSFEARQTQVGEQLLYTGGKQNDSVTLIGASIGDLTRLLLGDGTNAVVLDQFVFVPGPGVQRTQIGEQLEVTGGTGNDSITSDHATAIGEFARFLLAGGDNSVSLRNTQVGTDLLVKTAEGNDTADLAGTVVHGKQTISLGAGTNTGP